MLNPPRPLFFVVRAIHQALCSRRNNIENIEMGEGVEKLTWYLKRVVICLSVLTIVLSKIVVHHRSTTALGRERSMEDTGPDN